MAIKGSLKEASLADVCQLLHMSQKTGCLSVTDQSRFGQIYFDQGRITYARILNRRDRLGDLLVRDGVLSPEALRAVLDRQTAEPHRRLGELLVDEGLLERAMLERYIRFQIQEAVYSLFTWASGGFFFEAGDAPAGELLTSLNPESLLLEAARRVDEWSLIEKKVPSLDLIFETDQQRLRASDVELEDEQQRIVDLLDGTRTVQEIIDETGLGEFAVGKALFGLIQAGFAARVGRREDEGGARARDAEVEERRNLGVAFSRTGLVEEAEREFRRVVELRPTDLVARFNLGLLALRAGRPKEALRRFRLLTEDAGPRHSVFINMAHALRLLGHTGDALLVLAEAEQLRPGLAITSLARAATLVAAGEPTAAGDALVEYRDRLGSRRAPPAVYFHYAALTAALLGRLDEAQALARQGLTGTGAPPALLLLAGAIAERAGDLDQAEALYRRSADEDTELPQAQKALGDVAYRRGAHDEALAFYQRAAELAPDLGDDLYLRLGNLQFKRHEREEAVRCWQRALQLNPANAVVRKNLEAAAHAG
jgi:tetratricopeptide (TPR) repeat protein